LGHSTHIYNDIDLFEQIKNGNQKSFEELFNRYYNVLSNYSSIILNNNSCAEEVVADVFANIWIKRKKITINKNVKAYLYRSTRNTAISYLRKRKQECETIDENKINFSQTHNSPDNELIREDSEFRLKNLLNKIPERSREVFILHRFNNLKYVEIAETLNVSIKTIEKHMTKSLKIIREYYKNT